LLFNWNDCRTDREAQSRFYQRKNLNTLGCHGFQFQVWRYAGESRYLVSAIANVIFVILVQIQTINHLSQRQTLLENKTEIDLMLTIARNPSQYTAYVNTTVFE
jgi:hypothetical protein